ncbi:unnamed protein product [Paramecium sonneborni]|uniref:Uncharacterized protein n=1 Tax=Paramecium sonneborni TaxID=65129 RepID=A0A8S1R7F0_9CILI|nr:unnamed protein product [Paramecium sonneborni]
MIEYSDIPQKNTRISKHQEKTTIYWRSSIQISIENSANFSPIAGAHFSKLKFMNVNSYHNFFRSFDNQQTTYMHQKLMNKKILGSIIQVKDVHIKFQSKNQGLRNQVLDLIFKEEYRNKIYIFQVNREHTQIFIPNIFKQTSRILNLDFIVGLKQRTFLYNWSSLQIMGTNNQEESLRSFKEFLISQQWIDAYPHIIVYLSDLNYPLIDLTLQIDGQQSDAPQTIQKTESQIINEENVRMCCARMDPGYKINKLKQAYKDLSGHMKQLMMFQYSFSIFNSCGGIGDKIYI